MSINNKVEKKYDIVGIKHILDENGNNIREVDNHLSKYDSTTKKIGYELTPEQLEDVSHIVRILEGGTDFNYDYSLEFAVEFYKLAKKYDFEIIPLDNEELFRKQLEISERSCCPFLKTDEENERIKNEYNLINLERSAYIGHEIIKHNIPLNFTGFGHMVDLKCIFKLKSVDFHSQSPQNEIKEVYEQVITDLTDDQDKITELKKQYF
ncbi:MAG: hypothetical protein KAI18_01320 [Candidatus Aenigmarchaeota archaeon]|nr:hypothetical protein [Candidatus Aenigmarchaeota archaeon]